MRKNTISNKNKILDENRTQERWGGKPIKLPDLVKAKILPLLTEKTEQKNEIIEIMDSDDDNHNNKKKNIKPIVISNDILTKIASDYCDLQEKIIMTMAITGNETNIIQHDK